MLPENNQILRNRCSFLIETSFIFDWFSFFRCLKSWWNQFARRPKENKSLYRQRDSIFFTNSVSCRRINFSGISAEQCVSTVALSCRKKWTFVTTIQTLLSKGNFESLKLPRNGQNVKFRKFVRMQNAIPFFFFAFVRIYDATVNDFWKEIRGK